MSREARLDAVLAALVVLGFLLAIGARVTASRPAASAIPASGPAPSGAAAQVPGEPDLAQRTEVPSAGTRRPSPVPSSRPVVSPPAAGPAISTGLASWYVDPADPDGIYAALPGAWRAHRRILVCGPDGECYSAPVVTRCGCPGDRVVDLSRSLFARLAPLSQGLVTVRLEVFG